MSCCNPNMSPEIDQNTPIVAEPLPTPAVLPEGIEARTVQIINEMISAGICRGSRVEVTLNPEAQIYDSCKLSGTLALGADSLVGIVGKIGPEKLTITPGWRTEFTFSGHKYPEGPRLDIGYFEIRAEDITGYTLYRQ